jgi:hypothetical protein
MQALPCLIAGLAGYVEYPTQELVSGLYPLSEVPNMSTLSTNCIKPGQGSYNSTTTVRDNMVSSPGSWLVLKLDLFARLAAVSQSHKTRRQGSCTTSMKLQVQQAHHAGPAAACSCK